jgi:hypothetical protein
LRHAAIFFSLDAQQRRWLPPAAIYVAAELMPFSAHAAFAAIIFRPYYLPLFLSLFR